MGPRLREQGFEWFSELLVSCCFGNLVSLTSFLSHMPGVPQELKEPIPKSNLAGRWFRNPGTIRYCHALGLLILKAISLAYIATVPSIVFAGLASKPFFAEAVAIRLCEAVHRRVISGFGSLVVETWVNEIIMPLGSRLRYQERPRRMLAGL